MNPGTELIPTTGNTLAGIAALVTDNLSESPQTRRVYRRHIERFIEWHTERHYASFSKTTVRNYLEHLRTVELVGAASRNQALTVLRKLAEEAADAGYLAPEVLAGIVKIKAVPVRGTRTGNWLTMERARELLTTPDLSTLAGRRDRAALGLMCECGLRRDEAVKVQCEQLQTRDKRWVLVDLLGKGHKHRTVPVPARCASRIHEWLDAAGITDGPIIRRVDKAGHVGAGMSATALYKIVTTYARRLGISCAPHDLRRTFGRLAHENGAAIEQISRTLGHADIATTEIYLGIRIDLDRAPCDTFDVENGE